MISPNSGPAEGILQNRRDDRRDFEALRRVSEYRNIRAQDGDVNRLRVESHLRLMVDQQQRVIIRAQKRF
ncbi:hypothetical protein, partial [Bradyrhizobium sp. ARR65]